jgi:methyl-accepting chemotaxis protein
MNWLNKWRIRQKMYLVVGIALGVGTIAGVIGALGTWTMLKTVEELHATSVQPLISVGRMNAALKDIEGLIPAVSAEMVSGNGAVAQLQDRLDTLQKEYTALKEVTLSAEESEALKTFAEGLDKLKAKQTEFTEAFRAAQNGSKEGLTRAVEAWVGIKKKLVKPMIVLVEGREHAVEASVNLSKERALKQVTFTAIVLLGGLFAALLLTHFIVRAIVKPLHKVRDSMHEVSRTGNLCGRVAVETKDVIGDVAASYNLLLEAFQGTVRTLQSAVDTLRRQADLLADNGRSLRGTTDEQAISSQRAAAAMEQMSATIAEVARNTTQAANYAHTSAELAAHGGSIVQSAIGGMQRISSSVRESADVVSALGASSQRIGEIVSVIDNIASQTNLLALNAAIEAARAGDQGRGFAVVADEVRELAKRTSTATKEIAAMVASIQNESSRAVQAMDKAKSHADEGTTLSTQAGGELSGIVASVNQVSDMIQQIAAATEQQSKATDEISKTSERMAELSQQTNDTAASTAQASDELLNVCRIVSDTVGRFKA